MRMLRASVHLELLQHSVTKLVLGQHAAHGHHDEALRLLTQHIAESGGPEAADPAGVTAVQLVGHLGAGHLDLLAVDHDDEIPVIHMGSKFGLMLAAQAMGDLAGQTAQNLILGIDHIPVVLDVLRSRAESLHENDSVCSAPQRRGQQKII